MLCCIHSWHYDMDRRSILLYISHKNGIILSDVTYTNTGFCMFVFRNSRTSISVRNLIVLLTLLLHSRLLTISLPRRCLQHGQLH
ncbi:hypothetical protein FKM82_013788 [Ascaphus truei]